MNRLVTPPINTVGIYVVKTPFVVRKDVVYKCYAIRTISEYVTRNIDPYELFYKPLKIEQSEYERDVARNVSIISLISADNEYVYVPNTYILSYPGMSGIPYSNKAILVELGMVPDAIELSELIKDIKDVTTKSVGVTAVVKEAIIPYLGSVSHEQYISLERTRRLKIAEHETKDETIARMTKIIDGLQKDVRELTKAVISGATKK